MAHAEDPAPMRSTAAALWANPQARYPVLVVLYIVVLGVVFNASLASLAGRIEALEDLTAGAVYWGMRLFTDSMRLRGSLVTFDGFSVDIIPECIGLLEMLIYGACVLAFPATLRARAIGIVFGCAAIFVFNLVRIATLLVVGRYWHAYFDFFHVYFWQGTLIAMIVGVLYAWIRIFAPR